MTTKDKFTILAKIQVSYDRTWIMPLDQGLELMRSLGTGELLKDSYGKDPDILPLDEDITLSLISSDKIKEIKMAKVLEINGDNKNE